MVDALWFIPGHGDGPYLGTDVGKRAPTHEYLAAVARAIDSLGYYGALIPTGFGCEDSWVIASSLFPLTQRMKFLIAFRPADGWVYFPSVVEILITAGVIAGEIAAYIAIVKTFPILSAPAPARPKVRPVPEDLMKQIGISPAASHGGAD